MEPRGSSQALFFVAAFCFAQRFRCAAAILARVSICPLKAIDLCAAASQLLLTAQTTLPEPPLLYIVATNKFSNMRQEQPLVPPQFLHT